MRFAIVSSLMRRHAERSEGGSSTRSFAVFAAQDDAARQLSLHDGENFVLAQNGVFDIVDLDVGAGVLADEDRVASLDVELHTLARVVELPFADGDDLSLLRLFLGGIGNNDAAAGRRL